jgi:peptidoglycan/LPS O-acetylase OafA/YrhL
LDQKKPTAAKDSRRRSSLISDSLAHPRASYYLVLVPTVLLLAIGMLMVWSASSVFGYVRFDDAYYFVKRQVFFLVIGGLAAFVLSKCSTGTLRVLGWVLVVVSLGLQILTFTPLGWGEAKGNRNWVQFGTSFFAGCAACPASSGGCAPGALRARSTGRTALSAASISSLAPTTTSSARDRLARR